MLDRLADGMTFGALERCPTCKKGQLEFRLGSSYVCLAQDEWTNCGAIFDEPARKPFSVPESLKKKRKFVFL